MLVGGVAEQPYHEEDMEPPNTLLLPLNGPSSDHEPATSVVDVLAD
jgi:hypothetical protein